MDVASSKNAMIIERDKHAKILIFACVTMYMLMMGSKNVYTAELVVLQGVFSVSKAQVSLAMTYYFITYAAGQVILSLFMGKLNLKVYLTITGGASAIFTILMGFTYSLSLMYLLCAINGALQAGIYSGCMAVLSKYVPSKMLPYANKIMTAGTVLYGVIAYGTPAIFVGQGLWNAPFILLGVLFLASVVFFFCAVHKMKKFPNVFIFDAGEIESVGEKVKPFIEIRTKKGKATYLSFMIIIALFGNVIYYAVNSWVPDMLHSVHLMPQEFSILITLIVPIVSGVFSIVSISLCEKHKNIITVSAVFYVICTVLMVLIVFLFDKNMVVAIILVSVFIGATSGGRSVFGGVIAFKMNTVINSGSYLASTNAMAAVMAGVVPPLIGMVIDAGGGIVGFLNSYLITLAFLVVNAVILISFAVWYNSRNKKQNKD